MNHLNIDSYRYEGDGDVLQNQKLSLWEIKFNNWERSLETFFVDVKLLGCEVYCVEVK